MLPISLTPGGLCDMQYEGSLADFGQHFCHSLKRQLRIYISLYFSGIHCDPIRDLHLTWALRYRFIEFKVNSES